MSESPLSHGPQEVKPEPQFDFDRVHDRRGTTSIKWEFLNRNGVVREWTDTDPAHGDDSVLPMWVADMDFHVAQPIQDAVAKRASHGLYGYAKHTSRYLESVVNWMQRRQGWHAEPDWIVPAPGVVPAIHLIVRRFSERGDKVLIQRPVYHPFSYAAENNGREVVSNPLVYRDGRYAMDFADLEVKAADPLVKVALLCSPHNPVGRVWSDHELRRFAQICTDNGVLIVADEIHSDLTMPGHTFSPIGNLADDILQNTIICTAPSKAFNLAGLQSSNLIIRNEELRNGFEEEKRASGLFSLNPFGIAATQAAYDESEGWLDRAIAYIDANLDFLETYTAQHLPGIELIRPEATYLAWLDCGGLKLDEDTLASLFFDEAKLYLDEGRIFGVEGEGFMRLNVACPRVLLETALSRLRDAIARLKY